MLYDSHVAMVDTANKGYVTYEDYYEYLMKELPQDDHAKVYSNSCEHFPLCKITQTLMRCKLDT